MSSHYRMLVAKLRTVMKHTHTYKVCTPHVPSCYLVPALTHILLNPVCTWLFLSVLPSRFPPSVIVCPKLSRYQSNIIFFSKIGCPSWPHIAFCSHLCVFSLYKCQTHAVFQNYRGINLFSSSFLKDSLYTGCPRERIYKRMAPITPPWNSLVQIFTSQMDFLLRILTKPTRREIHTATIIQAPTLFFFWKGLLSVSKNNKIGRDKAPSLTKHPNANNRMWIMQQEFIYNKCLKNKGSDRHWDLGCTELTGCDFRLCPHHEMSPRSLRASAKQQTTKKKCVLKVYIYRIALQRNNITSSGVYHYWKQLHSLLWIKLIPLRFYGKTPQHNYYIIG